MVNIKIDTKSLSKEIKKYIEPFEPECEVEARELPDGRVAIRRIYPHKIVSSVIPYESTDATVGNIEEVGEDKARVTGRFYLKFTDLRKEAAKARERKGV